MEKEILHNSRLLLFADHIAGIKNHPEHGLTTTYSIVELDEGIHIHYDIICHDYIFEELLVFEDSWSYNDEGMPSFIEISPEENTLAGVVSFFGLSPEETAFIFDLSGHQSIDLWPGGNILNMKSTGLQIAQNILLVVRKRRGKL
jgi:hypothetical protein